MTHPLQTIAESGAVVQKAPDALKTGHVNYAADLVNTFANPDENATKMVLIENIASILTPKEFAEQVKKAKELADTIDAANGFKKPEDAKGQASYGPRRQQLNSRMSEAKRLFGVFKQAPSTIKGLGYWQALAAARKWLDDNGKTWDGNHAETKEEKATRKEQSLQEAALAAVKVKHPQQPGESLMAYLSRVESIYEEQVNSTMIEAAAARVATIKKSLLKQFGDEMEALKQACTEILAGDEASEEETNS